MVTGIPDVNRDLFRRVPRGYRGLRYEWIRRNFVVVRGPNGSTEGSESVTTPVKKGSSGCQNGLTGDKEIEKEKVVGGIRLVLETDLLIYQKFLLL